MGWRAAVGALLCLLVACGQGVGLGLPASTGTGARTDSGASPSDAGTGRGFPGNDAGEETGDAGPDGGGPAGAGHAGLPPLPDGSSPGPTICTDPAPADVCDALAPPPGTSVVHRSFVIQLGGRWAHRIQPGATTLEPAPCWLTSRPSTDLVAIRGGTAYAAIHRASEECDRVVEVLTPEGRTCGFTAVNGTDGRCELAVGRDGTLSKGAEVVPAGAGQPRSCVLEFWPGALGRTGY